MKLRPTLISTGVALALAAPAQASCVPAGERDDFERADAVADARVLYAGPDGRATFRVLKVRKGGRRIRAGQSLRVQASPYPSSITMSWNPRRGQRWRLYLQREDGRWTTNDCTGTSQL